MFVTQNPRKFFIFQAEILQDFNDGSWVYSFFNFSMGVENLGSLIFQKIQNAVRGVLSANSIFFYIIVKIITPSTTCWWMLKTFRILFKLRFWKSSSLNTGTSISTQSPSVLHVSVRNIACDLAMSLISCADLNLSKLCQQGYICNSRYTTCKHTGEASY